MILYHYSVDSYKDGGELLNDFNKLRRFAEPFVFALEKGEDCFWSTFFSAMYYSRELCALGLRKRENYVKDSVEGVFEYVRRQKPRKRFSPSRLQRAKRSFRIWQACSTSCLVWSPSATCRTSGRS